MIRYAIVDGTLTTEALGRLRSDPVDFVQLRDTTLPAGELAGVAEGLLDAIAGTKTKLLIHSRADVAMATGAHGVHLPSRREQLTPGQVRALYARAGMEVPVISLSVHSLYELAAAREADLILFAPVFEKRVGAELVMAGVGLAALAEVCRAAAPGRVLALGGVTAANAEACVLAGAAGVAGIRLFAEA